MSAALVPAGEPDYGVQCIASQDRLLVRSYSREDKYVGIYILSENGSQNSVLINSETARKLGAALLNHADKLDGIVPLRFFPPGVADGVYPDGHPDK